MHKLYRALQKSKSESADSQHDKELRFKECLQDLFDIAHFNAIKIIKYNNDKEFLLAQMERGSRRCYIASVHKKMLSKEGRKRKRIERHEILEEAKIQRLEGSLEPSDNTSWTSNEEKSDDSDEFYIPADISEAPKSMYKKCWCIKNVKNYIWNGNDTRQLKDKWSKCSHDYIINSQITWIRNRQYRDQ